MQSCKSLTSLIEGGGPPSFNEMRVGPSNDVNHVLWVRRKYEPMIASVAAAAHIAKKARPNIIG